MIMILYIICGILYAILAILVTIVPLYLYLLQKKEHREMQEYLHRWQIESDQNAKNAQRIIDEIQKTNHDNSIFLRMIFERVDDPQTE